jgi:HSP20 family protein
MATVRWWSPTTDLVNATRLMDRLFDQAFGGLGSQGADKVDEGTPTYALPVDVLETDDTFTLYATVAGTPGENVDVTFEDGVLSIVVKAAPFDRQGRWLRQERPWGNWTRKLELPKEVQADGIEAHVENGVLTVTVPKVASAQPVRIPVVGGGSRQQLKG